jgi:chromate transporter
MAALVGAAAGVRRVRPVIALATLAGTFLWLSFLCVGGGLGVLPEMQRQVVDRHHWVTAREFVDGYTLSQLTPGPSMLVVVFVGFRAHGISGAIAATLGMFVPTSVLTAVVAHHWGSLRDRPLARAVERALTPIGVGLMAAGAWTLARSAVHDVVSGAIAAAALVVFLALRLPPIVVVLAAGGVGWLAGS